MAIRNYVEAVGAHTGSRVMSPSNVRQAPAFTPAAATLSHTPIL